MANLYNRYVPQAPGKLALGQRLLGDPRGVERKMAIKRASVQSFFSKGLEARAMVSQPSPYGLVSSTTRGLAGFGRFGFLGAFSGEGQTIFGPFNFGEAWSFNDFMGMNANWLAQVQKQVGLDPNVGPAGSYNPPPDSLAAKASEVWSRIEEARYFSPAVESFASNVEARMRSAIADADRGTRQNIIVGTDRRWAIYERQRIQAFNNIKVVMSEVAQYVVPPTAATQPPVNTGGGSTMPSGNTATWTGGRGLPVTTPNPSNPSIGIQASGPAATGPSTMTLVGVGVGVLAIGGIAYMLLKR